ncbi:MAG: DUF309 domain-containing protein [Thermoprotei archaeon]
MSDRRVLCVFKNKEYKPEDITLIRSSLLGYINRKKLGLRFSNIRVSNQNIQVDIYLDNNNKPASVRTVLGGWLDIVDVVDLSVDRYAGMRSESIINMAVELFNQERFWEFHEAIEAVWRSEPPGPRKELLQGMILVAASLVHAQKGRVQVGLGILERGFEKLQSIPPQLRVLFQVDLNDFMVHVESMLADHKLQPFKIVVWP